MSTQKNNYYQQVVNTFFQNNHNPNIRQLYTHYPALSASELWLISHFMLHKKYNNANKTLGSTGAGLITTELKENPVMKRLLATYTTNPGQDFTAEALHHFSQSQGATRAGQLPIISDSWVTGGPVGINKGDSVVKEELEKINDKKGDIPMANNTQAPLSHETFASRSTSASKGKGTVKSTSESSPNTTEVNTTTKQMKIQAAVVVKELKICDDNAQHEHELKMKMVDHKHAQLMANEKMKQLELELWLEEARIHCLEAEGQACHNEDP
ncbi:hypothetical protein J3A83DRAFT_4188344 [Scleroderma citrinum]